MKRMIACVPLAAMALLALAGGGCFTPKTEPATKAPQPRDLTPVTWLETPKHAPVEIVLEGEPVAVVYVADPKEKGKFDYDTFNQIRGDIFPPPALPNDGTAWAVADFLERFAG